MSNKTLEHTLTQQNINIIKQIIPMMNFVNTSTPMKFYGASFEHDYLNYNFFLKHLPINFSTEELAVIIGDNSNPIYNIQREIISKNLLQCIIDSIPCMFEQDVQNNRKHLHEPDITPIINEFEELNAFLRKIIKECTSIIPSNNKLPDLSNSELIFEYIETLNINYKGFYLYKNDIIKALLNKSPVLNFFNNYTNIICTVLEMPEYKDIIVNTYIKHFIANKIHTAYFNDEKSTSYYFYSFNLFSSYIVKTLYNHYIKKQHSMPYEKLNAPVFDFVNIIIPRSNLVERKNIKDVNPFVNLISSMNMKDIIRPYNSVLYINETTFVKDNDYSFTYIDLEDFEFGYTTDIDPDGKPYNIPLHKDDTFNNYVYNNTKLKVYDNTKFGQCLESINNNLPEDKRLNVKSLKEFYYLSQEKINLLK